MLLSKIFSINIKAISALCQSLTTDKFNHVSACATAKKFGKY